MCAKDRYIIIAIYYSAKLPHKSILLSDIRQLISSFMVQDYLYDISKYCFNKYTLSRDTRIMDHNFRIDFLYSFLSKTCVLNFSQKH